MKVHMIFVAYVIVLLLCKSWSKSFLYLDSQHVEHKPTDFIVYSRSNDLYLGQCCSYILGCWSFVLTFGCICQYALSFPLVTKISCLRVFANCARTALATSAEILLTVGAHLHVCNLCWYSLQEINLQHDIEMFLMATVPVYEGERSRLVI